MNNTTKAFLCGALLGVCVLVGLAAVNVVPTSGGWSFSGSTNATLSGTAYTYNLTVTNALTAGTIVSSNITSYGYAERTVAKTHAGTWTFDLSATNRIYSCVNTGALALTFSNFTEGNQVKIVLGNSQTTNCANTFTAPASTTLVWEGLTLTNIAPAKWQTLYFDCKTVTGTNYIFATGAEQQ